MACLRWCFARWGLRLPCNVPPHLCVYTGQFDIFAYQRPNPHPPSPGQLSATCPYLYLRDDGMCPLQGTLAANYHTVEDLMLGPPQCFLVSDEQTLNQGHRDIPICER